MGKPYEPAVVGKFKQAQSDVVFSIIPRAMLIKCEQILMGALLREPFSVPQYIGQLYRIPLSHADTTLAPAFAEILTQFAEFGTYSPNTIEQRTGIDVSYWASECTEIDLSWAISEWWEQYQIWGEATALMQGISEAAMAGGALVMRGAVEEAREKLGLNCVVTTKDNVKDFMTWAADKIEGNERIYKTSVPIDSIKHIVKHFRPGELWLIAARPGQGKTILALNILYHFFRKGCKGLFFSLEMSATSLMERLMGIVSGVNAGADWKELNDQVLWQSVGDVAMMGEKVKIIDGVYNINEIESAAISAYYRGELDFIILDYIQLCEASGRFQDRNNEISKISRVLMRVANRLKIPVVALSQLSRDVEKRGGSKRPQLSDLRDSGALEQDAYGVIFIYRPEEYNIFEDETGQSLKGVAELIFAKHRSGPVGIVKTSFTPIRGFRDLIPESKFPTSAPQDFTIPKSADIPRADISGEQIPF